MGSRESWRLFLQTGFGQHYLVLVLSNRFRWKFLQIGYSQNFLRSELGIYSPHNFFIFAFCKWRTFLLWILTFIWWIISGRRYCSAWRPSPWPSMTSSWPLRWAILMASIDAQQTIRISWSAIYYIFFPSDLAYKLYDRKAKCLLPFKRMKEVKKSW